MKAKSSLFSLLIFATTLTLQAQVPQRMNYQAILRNAGGNILPNQNVCVQSSITDSIGNATYYQETFSTTTNQFGLFTLPIGKGTPIIGTFSSIDWGGITPWQKIEIQIECTGSYVMMGSSKLLSVPYSLFAQNSGNVNGALNYLARFSPNGNSLSTSQVYADGMYTGIGNNTPVNKLEIGNATGFIDNDLAIGNNGKGMSFYQSAGTSYWYSSTNFALMSHNGGNGFLGIGNPTPINKVEIGQATGFSGNDLAIGNGTKGMSFLQTNSASTWYSSTDFALMPAGSTGYVGIGTQSPTNKLQIGGYTNSNYGGNQLAFGFGTLVTVMDQGSSLFNLLSSNYINIEAQHDIFLNPGNGAGHVGINTNSPIAPLEVDGYDGVFAIQANIGEYGPEAANYYAGFSTSQVSIYAPGLMVGLGFNAISDKRIKNIQGRTNSTADLETLNSIKITDYTMKDVNAFGHRPFKKVIAQEVEEVYPQVVSKQQNYIPNVYRNADKIEKTTQGYLFSFNAAHGVSADATKIQVIDDSGMHRCDVVSIPDDKHILLSADRLSDHVFVYGELVNDFRTVDYDGLTTLTISATQELYKHIKALEAENDELKTKLEATTEKQEVMEQDINTLKQMVMQQSENQHSSQIK